MPHLRARVEVTAGRRGGLGALPMLPGETMPLEDAAPALFVDDDPDLNLKPGYDQLFEIVDEANPASELS